MAKRFSESGFGKRTLENDEHWISLDLDGYRITRPTIIVLGGNATTDYKKAKRACGTVERIMQLKQSNKFTQITYEGIDVLGFYYGLDNETDTSGYFSRGYVSKIVDNLFLPLFFDKKGNRLSLEKACKNFSLITVFAHCHGAREINYIMADLTKKLLQKGYTQEETEVIYGQGFQVSFTPMPDEAYMPCVRIDSFSDSFNICYGMANMFKDTYGFKLDGVSIQYDKAGTFRMKNSVLNHNGMVSIYVSQLINTPENSDPRKLIDEHSLDCIERNNDWSIANGAKCADAISGIVSIVLNYAVNNSYANYKYPTFVPKKNMLAVCDDCKTYLSFYKPEELKSSIKKVNIFEKDK